MSARAAWRLETLGFKKVYRYVGGKMDWAANDLPTEGHALHQEGQIGSLVHREVPACALPDTVGTARSRADGSEWKMCLVVNEQGVLLGRLRRAALRAAPETPVTEVMEPGPSTFRPNVGFREMSAYMRENGLATALVTTADGILLGAIRREEVGAAARRLGHQVAA